MAILLEVCEINPSYVFCGTLTAHFLQKPLARTTRYELRDFFATACHYAAKNSLNFVAIDFLSRQGNGAKVYPLWYSERR